MIVTRESEINSFDEAKLFERDIVEIKRDIRSFVHSKRFWLGVKCYKAKGTIAGIAKTNIVELFGLPYSVVKNHIARHGNKTIRGYGGLSPIEANPTRFVDYFVKHASNLEFLIKDGIFTQKSIDKARQRLVKKW